MSNFSQTQSIRKSVVKSTGGIVAAQHRRASEAGAKVLAEGGNAIDAAIATSFAMGVVEPWMSGPGGGGYMVVHMAKENTTKVIDFGMRSPCSLDPADYPLSGGKSSDLFPWPAVVEDRNVSGGKSIAVPGVVEGMRLALETFGTGNWKDLLQPAIGLAREGLLVDWYAQLLISSVASDLARFPKSKQTFLKENGYPKASAWTALNQERADMSSMAETLSGLAENGPRWFYEGELAKSIVADVAALGGYVSEEDLASYQASLTDCMEIDYAGGKVYLTPELTAGPTMARAYRNLPRSCVAGTGPTAETFVGYAESLLEAYSDRLERMGDVEGRRGDTCTTHFNVVDRDGNMVAVTQTLLSAFGSKVMLPQSGLMMNNGVMWFDPEPGKPNSIGPDRKCLTNMCPVIGEIDGTMFAMGASGGRKILPAVAQLTSFVMDFGMSLEDAFHAPRIDVSGTETVIADDTLPADVIEALQAKFNCVVAPRTVFPYNFACPSAVARKGDVNEGMTEIMSPWGDAIAQA